jgi:hypothetical protein
MPHPDRLLQDYDQYHAAAYRRAQQQLDVHTGICCPHCRQGELVDQRPGVVLATLPPRRDCRCDTCGTPTPVAYT